jgi:hypothetical protein
MWKIDTLAEAISAEDSFSNPTHELELSLVGTCLVGQVGTSNDDTLVPACMAKPDVMAVITVPIYSWRANMIWTSLYPRQKQHLISVIPSRHLHNPLGRICITAGS